VNETLKQSVLCSGKKGKREGKLELTFTLARQFPSNKFESLDLSLLIELGLSFL